MKLGEEEVNPYKSPNELHPQFADCAPRDGLEERLAELTRALSRSWCFLPNFWTRLFVTAARVVLGYLIALAIIAPIAVLIEWLVS